MIIKVYGASDDLVEIEHLNDKGEPVKDGVGDELNCIDGGANIVIGLESVETDDGALVADAHGIRIGMRYGQRGCWEAHIAPIDEDIPCPYEVTVGIEKYTAVVTVRCPDGTPIKWKRVRIKR